jgi:hypothetical protein
MVFMLTNDPFMVFPPELYSRVTLVNFTVTLGSLKMQCLNKV